MIAPVNQVLLLNQVLLNQKKLTLQRPMKVWDQSIMAAKTEMLSGDDKAVVHCIALRS